MRPETPASLSRGNWLIGAHAFTAGVDAGSSAMDGRVLRPNPPVT